jgi:hypothetical protein
LFPDFIEPAAVLMSSPMQFILSLPKGHSLQLSEINKQREEAIFYASFLKFLSRITTDVLDISL